LKVLVQIDDAINKVDRLFKVASQVPSNSLYLDDLATKYIQVIQNNPSMILRCSEKLAQEVSTTMAAEHGANQLFASFQACPDRFVGEASEHIASSEIMASSMKVTMDSFGNEDFPQVLVSILLRSLPSNAEEKNKMITDTMKHLLNALNKMK
jgi:hypothetical protein